MRDGRTENITEPPPQKPNSGMDNNSIIDYVNKINEALKNNNFEFFVFHLYVFQKYMENTLLKEHPGMKSDEIQKKMADTFGGLFKDISIQNEFMFLAVQEILGNLKFSSDEDNSRRADELNELIRLENAFQTFFDLLGRRGISANANKYMDEGFEKVSMSDKKPNISDMQPNTIVMQEENGNLIAYWIKNGEVTSSTVEIKKGENAPNFKYIQENLPSLGEMSDNMTTEGRILIERIKSAYGFIHPDQERCQSYITENTNKLQNMLNDVKVKCLLMTTPIENISSKVDEIFSDQKEKNDFKRQLYKYQTEHAMEIYDAQVEMAKQSKREEILRKAPTYKDYLNIKPGEKKTGDILYEGKSTENNAKVKAWEERYKKEIIPDEVEKRIKDDGTKARIAFNFLKNIQDTIHSTTWKVSSLKGTKVEDTEGNFINTVPPYMVKILAVMEKAYKIDPEGKTDIWIKSLNEVVKIGIDAAKHKPISIFGKGKRDVATQEFYDRFVTAYANRDLYLNEKNKNNPSPRK